MPDREKVIEGLTLCIADGYCDDCPYEEGCFDEKSHMPFGEEMMRDALALLKEQGWIPVTERLPELRHAVLCYSPHHKNIWALSLHEDGEWYYWIPMSQKYNPDFEGPITHWMPPPEPPQEGR